MTTVDERLQNRVRDALDAQSDAPDMLLQARLRAIRLNALDRARSHPRSFERLIPAGTVAAAIIVALTFSLSRPPTVEVVASDFELVTASQDIELIEDLEFYEWLENRGHAG